MKTNKTWSVFTNILKISAFLVFAFYAVKMAHKMGEVCADVERQKRVMQPVIATEPKVVTHIASEVSAPSKTPDNGICKVTFTNFDGHQETVLAYEIDHALGLKCDICRCVVDEVNKVLHVTLIRGWCPNNLDVMSVSDKGNGKFVAYYHFTHSERVKIKVLDFNVNNFIDYAKMVGKNKFPQVNEWDKITVVLDDHELAFSPID